jgi:hypothetical protein
MQETGKDLCPKDSEHKEQKDSIVLYIKTVIEDHKENFSNQEKELTKIVTIMSKCKDAAMAKQAKGF